MFFFGLSIWPFERDLGRSKAEFVFSGQDKVGFVFRNLGFGVGVAEEEGGAATVGRPPPSSLVSFGRGLRLELQSKRE